MQHPVEVAPSKVRRWARVKKGSKHVLPNLCDGTTCAISTVKCSKSYFIQDVPRFASVVCECGSHIEV